MQLHLNDDCVEFQAKTNNSFSSLAKNISEISPILRAYPIGAIYISTVSTSPSTLFGGTWEQITDKFLYAVKSSVTSNTTGGASSVTLAAKNLPAHAHSVPAHTHSLNNHTHGTGDSSRPYFVNAPANRLLKGITAEGDGSAQGPSVANTGASAVFNTTNTGSGSSFNILPPYVTVYMWRRTA